MAEITYYRNDQDKTISNVWGYCGNWKSHLKVAESLGYKLRNDYGFQVDTVNKVFILSDVKTYYKIVNREAYTPNDYRDYIEINRAWLYLKQRGYTTEDAALNKYVK